jgi:hypothetical protein
MIRVGPAPMPAESIARRLAPWALLRVAGTPLEQLKLLRPVRLTAAVARAEAIRPRRDSIAGPAEDELHAAVPATTDRDARRALIALKRDVHNGRRPKPATLAALDLSGAGLAVAADWLHAALELDDALGAARTAWGDEVVNELPRRLRSLFRDPLLAGAVALSRPDAYDGLMKPSGAHADGRPGRADRTLLGYVMRAAAKTSPFSTFLLTAPVAVDAHGPDWPLLGEASAGRRVRPARAPLLRTHLAALTDDPGETPLARNPTLSARPEGGVKGLLDAYSILGERLWRHQRSAALQLHADVVAVLLGGPEERTRAQWLTELVSTGLDARRAETLLAKLVGRGLLRWPIPYDAHSDLTQLPEALRVLPLALALADLAEQVAGTTAHERARSLVAMRSRVEQTLSAPCEQLLGRHVNLVDETGVLHGVGGGLGAAFVARATVLAAWLGGQVRLKGEHVLLRDAFVRQYGAGGTCTDVAAFLAACAPRLLDPASVPPPELPDPSRRLPLGVTALVQLVPGERLEIGGTGLVVNRVYEGIGWLAARHAHGDDDEARELAGWLRTWLVDALAPREPVDVPINGETSDLQAHPRLTRRVLAWHGEPLCAHDGILRPDDLRLAHDVDADLLELRDAAGTALAPLLLGGAFPTPAWGVPYLLAALAQPHRLARPAGAAAPPHEERIECRPRLVEDGVVLTRAQWWIPSARLADVLAGGGVARQLAVRRMWDARGLPEIAYVQARRRAGLPSDLPIDARKPTWFDAANPWCVDLLARAARSADWVVVEEALPGAEDLWCEVDGSTRVAEIHLELTV